jgi:hypothetical protein
MARLLTSLIGSPPTATVGPLVLRPQTKQCNCSTIKSLAKAGVHTYHSRFIPEGVAEASQIFLRDSHVLPKLFSYEYTAEMTDD